MRFFKYTINQKYLRPMLLIWVTIIFTVSSLPADRIPVLDGINVDKLLHIAVYYVLGCLLLWNHKAGLLGSFTRYQVLLAAIIFASLDEAHQSVIPNRSVSVYDLAANMAGLFISYFVSIRNGKEHD